MQLLGNTLNSSPTNIGWTSPKSSWPPRLLPDHYHRCSSSPGLQSKSRSRLEEHVLPWLSHSEVPSPCSSKMTLISPTNRWWQAAGGAVLTLRPALQMAQMQVAIYSICIALPVGSHCLCPGQRWSAPHIRAAFQQPTHPRQGQGKQCIHFPWEILEQKQPERPSGAELEEKPAVPKLQRNIVMTKPVFRMLPEEKHLLRDLHIKLLNSSYTFCPVRSSIQAWSESVLIAGFCHWRQEPLAKP